MSCSRSLAALAMPGLDSSTWWAGAVLEEGTASRMGPVSLQELKDALDCGCYANFQLLDDRLAVDEATFHNRDLISTYWNCWRSEFEKGLEARSHSSE